MTTTNFVIDKDIQFDSFYDYLKYITEQLFFQNVIGHTFKSGSFNNRNFNNPFRYGFTNNISHFDLEWVLNVEKISNYPDIINFLNNFNNLHLLNKIGVNNVYFYQNTSFDKNEIIKFLHKPFKFEKDPSSLFYSKGLFIFLFSLYFFQENKTFINSFNELKFFNRADSFVNSLWKTISNIVDKNINLEPFLIEIFSIPSLSKRLVFNTDLTIKNLSILSFVNKSSKEIQELFAETLHSKVNVKLLPLFNLLKEEADFDKTYLDRFPNLYKSNLGKELVNTMPDINDIKDSFNREEVLSLTNYFTIDEKQLYSVYKSIYTKSNFPLTANSYSAKISIDNCVLSYIVKRSLDSKSTFNITTFVQGKHSQQEVIQEVHEYVSSNYLHLLDSLIISCYNKLINYGDNSAIKDSEHNLAILTKFINEFKENRLAKNLSDKTTVSLKSKI